jgi:hypothetical protein
VKEAVFCPLYFLDFSRVFNTKINIMASATPALESANLPSVETITSPKITPPSASIMQFTVQSTPVRQLTITHGQVLVPLFLSHELYFVAEEVLKSEFMPLIQSTNAVSSTETPTELEVFTLYMSMVNAKCRETASTGINALPPSVAEGEFLMDTTPSASTTFMPVKTCIYLPLLQYLFLECHRRFIGVYENIHSTVANLIGFDNEKLNDADDPMAPSAYLNVLSRYYCAADTLQRYLPPGDTKDQINQVLYHRSLPALFKSDLKESQKAMQLPLVMAVFGGQGNNPDYFSELRRVVKAYGCLVSPLIEQADQHLHQLLLRASVRVRGLFPQGLSLSTWLDSIASTPAQEYMVAAPVSLPLIGLTQLVWYLATVKISGASFEEVRKNWFVGTCSIL